VDVDVRRVRHVIVSLCLMSLAATVIVLFVAGIQKNAQITRLQQDGIVVKVTVSGCAGLMGGSGSNLAGYDCTGMFTLTGHRYSDVIPGSALYSPGTALPGIVAPEDPTLLSTPRAMAMQHASWKVFLLPTVLLLILGLLLGATILKRRSAREASAQVPPIAAA